MFLCELASRRKTAIISQIYIGITTLMLTGCQLSDFDSAVRPMLGTVEQAEAPPAAALPATSLIVLGYRTTSDQINATAVADGAPAMQPALQCWLQVRYPHPGGKAGMAQAMLVTQPLQDPAAIFRSTVEQTLADPLITSGFTAAKKLDIDGEEAATMLSDLRNRKFFRRSELNGASAYIAVEAAGNDYGRPFFNQPAMDQLCLKCWHEGVTCQPAEPVNSPQKQSVPSANISHLRRLPPVSE